MSEKAYTPVYAQISLDLAAKIASGKLAEGEKISGRSGLAGLYHVSPETIRRAIQLLEDIDIVRTRAGSGIFVVSREQALAYVKRHQAMTGFREIRDEINQLVRQKEDIEARIKHLIVQLEDQASRLQNILPLYPYEVRVPDDSPFIGVRVDDSKFWQNTGGTIIAIKRGDVITNSPGPYAIFRAGDILLVTGDNGVDLRCEDFLRKKINGKT
ncbi:MAG: GntR family transcriptional regulator [Clostridiales bacterium]|nr:GntR family transcriptional regulator [Clostridiales bacterium]